LKRKKRKLSQAGKQWKRDPTQKDGHLAMLVEYSNLALPNKKQQNTHISSEVEFFIYL
jgi:hypothetical protein